MIDVNDPLLIDSRMNFECVISLAIDFNMDSVTIATIAIADSYLEHMDVKDHNQSFMKDRERGWWKRRYSGIHTGAFVVYLRDNRSI